MFYSSVCALRRLSLEDGVLLACSFLDEEKVAAAAGEKEDQEGPEA